MMRILTFMLIMQFCTSYAQDKLKFFYDPITGNQISRELCLNCPSSKASASKEAEEISKSDLVKFQSTDSFSYYPNPVKEELFLEWQIQDNIYVSGLKVYDINGQYLQSYNKTKEDTSQNMIFKSYSAGVYIVRLDYNNGEQKTIKIIKR
jgi:hypothetical protein